MRVLVTGSSAHLARPLLPLLCNDPRVDTVIGVDVAPPCYSHPRFIPITLDVRSQELERHLAGADALVHLAFVVMQGHLKQRRRDRELIRSINVAGSKNVFTTAARAGVATFVHLSSAAVYALPAIDERISEDAERGPLTGFAYAEDKVAVEDWLDTFEAQERVRLVRLRPHVILGPHAQPLLKALVRVPFHPRLPAPAPFTQCVHETDVAHAVSLALFSDAHGAFNLACANAASFRDIQRLKHRVTLPVPLPMLRLLLQLGWHAFGYGTDPAWLEGVRHSLVLDTGRARARLGWRPRYDSLLECVDMIEGNDG